MTHISYSNHRKNDANYRFRLWRTFSTYFRGKLWSDPKSRFFTPWYPLRRKIAISGRITTYLENSQKMFAIAENGKAYHFFADSTWKNELKNSAKFRKITDFRTFLVFFSTTYLKSKVLTSFLVGNQVWRIRIYKNFHRLLASTSSTLR